ncbi:MAG: cupin domain-containing protein [Rhodospirillaceae bacterium]
MSKPSKLSAVTVTGLTPHLGQVPPGYPSPWEAIAAGRKKWQLSSAFGLTDFGVNIVELPAGQASSLRHWHSHEDEFVYVMKGELALITDDGEQIVRPGMAVGFPKANANGHHFVNRGEGAAVYLEIGSRHADDATFYSDVDLMYDPKDGFVTKGNDPK